MGDAKFLVRNIKTKNIIINNGEINDLERSLINKYNAKQASDKYVYKNYEFVFLNDTIYKDNENKNSIVTYFEISNYNVLLMADVDKEIENNLIKTYNLPKMDILKIGHHGSNTSTSKGFIDVVSPKYSIISVGLKNLYGHPHKETLDTITGSHVLRTDKDGSIRFVFRKNMVNKYTCKPYIIVER